MTVLTGDRRTYSATLDTHLHDYAQLILPLRGQMQIETSAHQLALDESRLFFLPVGCLHRFAAQARNEFLVLDIPSHVAVLSFSAVNLTDAVAAPMDDRWLALRSLLLAELGEGRTREADPNSGSLHHLVRYACDRLYQEAQTQPRSLRHIHDHYADPLDLKTLADLEGYSLTYYCEWFKRLTGQTPRHYIQVRRLEAAAELLTHTDLPISHIAHQVGYGHAASLSRLFQRQYGRSPLSFRQQSRSGVKNT